MLKTERELMNHAYKEGGRDGVIALIGRRSSDGFFSDWTYLLAGPSYEYVKVNLQTWPPTLHSDQGRSNLVTLRRVPEDGGKLG